MGLLNSFNKKDDGQKLYEQAQSFFEEGKIREGYVFMEKAAEAGYPEAQFQLGCSIIELKYNKPIEEGLMWMNKAAEQNHIFAINNLAMCYQMGEGVNVDYAKALSLLEKAASLGDMMAYYNIGQVYIFGLGV